MKRCPYCAEEIQDDAIKCRFCGEWLKEKPEAEPEENVESKDAAAEGVELEDPADSAEGPEGDWEQYALDYSRKSQGARRKAWERLSEEQRQALLGAWTDLGRDAKDAIPTTSSSGIASAARMIAAIVFGTAAVITLSVFVADNWRRWGSPGPSSGQRPAPTSTGAESAARETAACRQDLQCWGDKHSISAAVYCEDQIERLAQYDSKWTDGWLEPKFSRFRWKNQSAGTVTYIGDKIQFQNGFGAWVPHVYECDFNPNGNRVLDVRAREGRLPQ